MTYLTKAGLIHKVAPKTYAATEKGKAFRAQHPSGITNQDLRSIEGWHDAWQPSKRTRSEVDTPTLPAEVGIGIGTSTPTEALDSAIGSINADLKSRLLDAILAQTPEFFEHLVLHVLQKMGYGSSRADAVEHLGQPNDEGVDGRINQDPLGLDRIAVQAKRYAPDRPIDRKTIQAFVGSMTGQGITQGRVYHDKFI
jgi:restriction system protein